jgi:CRISPR-associated protein Cas1
MNHLLDLAEREAVLRLDQGCLLVESDHQAAARIPLSDIAVVVLSHPQILCTRPALSGLCSAGGVMIVCDDRRMPVGMMLPLTGYHQPARRWAAQADAAKPLSKRLWQQLIRAKVKAQGRLLAEVVGGDCGLFALADRVRSGDPDNIEAQAARSYWQLLFNDLEFIRDFAADNQNRYLNYGYAVLRAIVARAICAAGLHPGLGIHHHHRDNPFCLADDLIEPFRPMVDRAVIDVIGQFGTDSAMTPQLKKCLIEPLLETLTIADEQRTLFDVAARLAASVATAFEGGSDRLALPEP